ncbi:MAG TPA: DUF6174 domain-containing protein [Longimicrobiaceae bacterium]|nr:DUF6174 domain-containing protein [Longimicrobiaceae bacterium]
MRLSLAIAAVVLSTAVLASCSEPMGPADETARLERHRRLWAAQGANSYRMTVRLHGAWTGGAAVIEVRGGVPVAISPLHHPNGPVAPETFRHHDTVEELFAVVQFALEQEAERLEVKYSSRFGVPSFVDVDLRSTWADDEHGFSVEDFRILK